MYLLVRRGGIQYGQRPRTMLAMVCGQGFIKSCNRYEVFIVDENGRSKYKRSTQVNASAVVKIWDRLPTPKQIKEAKLSQPITLASSFLPVKS